MVSDKQSIRREVLKNRDAISIEVRRRKDGLIYDRLINLEFFHESQRILFYVSFGSEVDTTALIEYALSKGKTVAVPKVIKDTSQIEVYRITDLKELVTGAFGIPEPLGGDKIEPTLMDMIVVPCVAFDEQCNRLGFGKGYYDRLLAPLKATKSCIFVALAYEEQVVGQIPTEPHDIMMDLVVTDKRILQPSKGTSVRQYP
jgi:5-formyltetrahydrofolate cyclo-ligase